MKLQDDKINRKEFVEKLYENIKNYNGQLGQGLTVVINGKYGVGKSTVLELLEDYNLEKKDFNIIKYDAWENNLFDNPLIPILYTISKLENKSEKIKDTAINIIKNIPRVVLSTLANVHNIDFQSLLNNENIFEKYDEYKSSIDKLKNVLKDYCSQHKTIMLVDELDRCLPEYQIKVLESLFHFHDINNLIILIALDENQLESTIQSKFGRLINIQGYLSKFIQYRIDLPENDTYSYLISQMKFQILRDDNLIHKTIIAKIFKSINLPLRECILLIDKLNLLFNDGKPHNHCIVVFTCVLLLLKHSNNGMYNKYFAIEKEGLWNLDKDVDLLETPFGIFMDEIKNMEMNKLFLYLKDKHFNLYLYLINLFYPIYQISLESIAIYMNCSIGHIKNVRDQMIYMNYPYNVNDIIRTINNLL